jgi:AcrR family transcriptional regulator
MSVVPLNRREAGKAERRARILVAAKELIRETGNAGLSMRALAARAGVSLATPYNLFGSRRTIVLSVLQDMRDFSKRFAALDVADPLDRIFAAVDLSMSFYTGDARFYRTIWAAVFDASEEARTEILSPARDAFWLGLARAAAEEGVTRAEIDPVLLHRQLDYVFRSVMLDWVVGDVSDRDLAPMARFGFAAMLAGAAAEGRRGELETRMRYEQSRLAKV